MKQLHPSTRRYSRASNLAANSDAIKYLSASMDLADAALVHGTQIALQRTSAVNAPSVLMAMPARGGWHAVLRTIAERRIVL